MGQDFELWLSRFDNFASSVPEDQRRNALLSFLDEKAYQAASNLDFNGSYCDFKQTLLNRFRPSTSATDLQTQFLSLTQKTDQSVADYADALMVAARRAFPTMDEYASDELLRGRFVSGLRDSTVRMQTQLQPKSTFAATVEAARFVESVSGHGGAATAAAVEAPEAMAVGIQRTLQELSEKISRLESKEREQRDGGVRRGADRGGRLVTCWKCGQPGHVQKFCRQKSGNFSGAAIAGTPFRK